MTPPRNGRAGLVMVLGLVWLYLAADVATPSMALDGVIYAAIAKLAAAGAGSFWFPPHFEAGVVSFHDHPPLGLWLLARWFALFGDAFWVERAFNGLLTLGAAAMIVHLAARADAVQRRAAAGAWAPWWPLAIFFLMPVSTYALKNNSLEALLTLATLLAVWAAWAGKDRPLLNVLVGLACLAALMVKGPVGLFPLAAPGCFALFVQGDWRRAVLNTAIAAFTLVVAFALLLTLEPARISLQSYFDAQLVATLAGDRAIEHGRVYQLGQLLSNIAIGSVLVLGVWLARREWHLSRTFCAYLMIGLAASLPVLISPRQYKHYLLPSLPYFAICLALLVRPKVDEWRSHYAWIAAGAVLMLAAARMSWYFGSPGKDVDELSDARAIAQAVAPATVDFCAASLQRRAYLTRYHGLRSAWTGADQAGDFLVCGRGFNDERFSRVLLLSDDLALWARLP